MDYIESEDTDIKETKSKKRNQERSSANIDDPTKGACSLSDHIANRDSTMLYHLQSYNDKPDENVSDRVVIEPSYLDNYNISVTTGRL